MRDFFKEFWNNRKKYRLLRKIHRQIIALEKLKSKQSIKQIVLGDLDRKYELLYHEKSQEKIEKTIDI